MAKKKKAVSRKPRQVKSFDIKNFQLKNFRESYASFILAAIVVVILGLLVANFFTNRNAKIDSGVQTSEPTEEQKIQETQQSGGKYTVASEDSLSLISQKYYGSTDYWPVLAKVNNITNPNIIFAGNDLQIPSKAKADEMQKQMTQTSYQVQSGDTLFIIAQKMYGDGSQWTRIDSANHVGRLPNGNPLIFAGNTLIIPR